MDSPDRLFQECARGNQRAWEEFVNRYGQWIAVVAMRTGRRWGIHHQEVEDLVQLIYTKLCSNKCHALVTFQHHGDGADYGYLRTFAAHAVIDYARKTNRARTQEIAVPGNELPEVGRPDNTAYVNLSVEQADRCLRRHLPPEEVERDLEIVRLYFQQDYTAASIASVPALGLTVKGVEAVIHRCRVILRKCFAAYEKGAGQ